MNSTKPGDPMALPDGKTCRDCRHLRRCVALLNIASTNTVCDFYPSRFDQYQAEAPPQTRNPGTC